MSSTSSLRSIPKARRTARRVCALAAGVLLAVGAWVASAPARPAGAVTVYSIGCQAGGTLATARIVTRAGRTFLEIKSFKISTQAVSSLRPAAGFCAWFDRGVRSGETSVRRMILETTGKTCPAGTTSNASYLPAAVSHGQYFSEGVYRTTLTASHPMYSTTESNNVLVVPWFCAWPLL